MKHIHFIGICGVAMSALAIAFKKAGYKVTGSDKGFYPPISTHLKDADVDFYPGWHVDKILRPGSGQVGKPDLVVVGNVAGSENPEWRYVQENNIPYKSYPEVIRDYFIQKNSIVCAGTYGKTSSTVLMTWIMKQAGMDPSYMFGGLSLNGMDAAEIHNDAFTRRNEVEPWSVVEGDEYKSARWDNGAKFFHYSPTHLLLTAVVWDHADVYPTEQLYVEAFEKLVKMVPKTGLIVMSEKAKEKLPMNNEQCSKIVTYGQSNKSTYQYTNIQTTRNGVTFDIIHNGKTYTVKTTQIAEYCADNFTGCFAMAHEIGIPADTILAAIGSFNGIKRRLEKRFDRDITVFDDIAHSPTKAASALAAIKKICSSKIIAVFEPNTGNRRPEAIPGYDHAFRDADTVIIPKLTAVKKDPNDPAEPMDGKVLADVITKTHQDVRYIEDDTTLVEALQKIAKPGDVIIFLGSHGFRGMIEELVSHLQSQSV